MYAWKPPSFDELLPSMPQPLSFDAATAPAPAESRTPVDELQALRSKAHQEGFLRGLQDGLQEGRAQGEALGREEGLKAGIEEGRVLGIEQGVREGRESVTELSASLRQVCESLTQMPQALERALTEWVYQTAWRLAGRQPVSRETFVQAVQEALMRLPRPGETLFLRIPAHELALWQGLVQETATVLAVTLLEDPQLQSGHAYLEVAGTRVDVGADARDALVRSALGLLPVASSGQDRV